MTYRVEIQQVAAQPLAVVRRQATPAELSVVVPQCCGIVWDFVRANGIDAGRHVALYWDQVMNVDIGVEVNGPFTGDGDVMPATLPAGSVATAAHIGPYHLLGQAHEAIGRWCDDNGWKAILPCWEIYGHWTDDVAKLRTDVSYRVERKA